MNNDSANSSFRDLVSYFEQQNTSNRQGQQLAQPQAIRPGSAGKLLAMDASFHSIANMQSNSPDPFSVQSQTPRLAQARAKFEFPSSTPSVNRRAAPRPLRISVGDNFASFHDNSSFVTSADLSSAYFGPFSPAASSRTSSHLGFPAALSSPTIHSGSSHATPRRRGHSRHDSHLSVASIDSTGSLLFNQDPMDLGDSLRIASTPPIMTPPSSPKKRKSPSKSPQKAKERPNYLDKAVLRDTGVTQDQINNLIGDPVPEDPKNWRCLWEGCSHLAARKENIRAHVQTHLGDRPYECPKCKADFVRPHDFTRHYTTHVDSRDFKCPDCPQAFNRADALQRHRDRDFCNGGAPQGSPTKVKRVLEAVEKKKDINGRREKKQAIRKKNASSTKRQDSAELSDEWWSSSVESPDAMSSDPGSPDLFVNGLDNISATQMDSQQYPAMSDFFGHPPVSHETVTANPLRQSGDLFEQLLAFGNDSSVSSADASLMGSLSPPASPEETHSKLPLKPFGPSRQKASSQKQGPTPPASRESMLDFLSMGTSSARGGGAYTVASAPSLPDLSSCSPSPIAFEAVNDFDELCNRINGSDNDAESPQFFDWQGSLNDTSGLGAQAGEYRLGDFDNTDWMKQPLMTDRNDNFSPDELFAGY